MSAKTLHARWLGKLTQLRPAPGRREGSGVAPHKPLLLICLLDLADEAELPRVLPRSASLALRFRAYATLVSERWSSRLDLRLPFYHLKTQRFWKALAEDGSSATAPENCATIELDPEFHSVLSDPEFRLDARLLLTKAYFTAPERVALLEAMGLRNSRFVEEQAGDLLATAQQHAKRKGRSARFQIGVVEGYLHTCALTGYRCFTSEGATVVDAAHIDSWAESQNDEPDNGLALSKTAHWMFDEGLWSVSDNFVVIVGPSRFTESGPLGFRLQNFANEPLRFDPKSRLRPSVESIRRHRQKHGFGD